MNALLCLDWWCATKHSRGSVAAYSAEERGQPKETMDQEKETNVNMHEETTGETQGQRSRGSHASTNSHFSSQTLTSSDSGTSLTPSGSPHTYHPFLQPRFSTKTQNLLLGILDIFTISTLAAHIATFFVSLPTAIAFCNIPSVVSYPELEFGTTNMLPSMRDRCIGLNVDIHVAGGFAVFMAIILGILHVIALAMRFQEYIRPGRDISGEKRAADEAQEADLGCLGDGAKASFSTVFSSGRRDSTHRCTSSGTVRTHGKRTISTTQSRISSSVSAEERSAGLRFVGWSGERADHAGHAARMRAGRTGGSETSENVTIWCEVLLECLVGE